MPSTVPAGELRTHPVRLRDCALETVCFRKKTPWTRPETVNWMEMYFGWLISFRSPWILIGLLCAPLLDSLRKLLKSLCRLEIVHFQLFQLTLSLFRESNSIYQRWLQNSKRRQLAINISFAVGPLTCLHCIPHLLLAAACCCLHRVVAARERLCERLCEAGKLYPNRALSRHFCGRLVPRCRRYF